MRPFIKFGVEGKMYNLQFGIGWFPGEAFKLFELAVLAWGTYDEYITIFTLTIGKLSVYLDIY